MEEKSNEKKNCISCHQAWKTGITNTICCVIKKVKDTRDTRCSHFEIKSGCAHWEKRSPLEEPL
jgi:hypothetical protein